MICRANQQTGFYMTTASTMKKLSMYDLLNDIKRLTDEKYDVDIKRLTIER